MNKNRATEHVLRRVKEEIADIDFNELGIDDLDEAVKLLKVSMKIKKLGIQYSEKCQRLEDNLLPEQQNVFYKFEWFIESLAPKQRKLFHEIMGFKEKMLELKLSEDII
jgi:hypothetical protein